MLELFSAELDNVRGEFGIIFAEIRELARIVLVDFRLHGIRAGQSRFLAHECRSRTEGKTSDVPNRLQQGRTFGRRNQRPSPAQACETSN